MADIGVEHSDVELSRSTISNHSRGSQPGDATDVGRRVDLFVRGGISTSKNSIGSVDLGFFKVALIPESSVTAEAHCSIFNLVSRTRTRSLQSGNTIFDSWIFGH